MTTGYQQPRTNQRHKRAGAANNTGRGANLRDTMIDIAESELADSYVLPGAELAPEELELEILAQQADEFTCSSCFLVRHRSQLAREKNSLLFCRDCEG